MPSCNFLVIITYCSMFNVYQLIETSRHLIKLRESASFAKLVENPHTQCTGRGGVHWHLVIHPTARHARCTWFFSGRVVFLSNTSTTESERTMHNALTTAAALLFLLPAACSAPKTQAPRAVELSCGQCNFGMVGSSCDLAVRFDGKSYFVDGSNIDDHGDAHAADGLCNAIRHAEVFGSVQGNRFVAESIVLTD